MTDASWEVLSNQAVAASGLVYFLALLAHLVQWAGLRKVPVEQAAGAGAVRRGQGVVQVLDREAAEPSMRRIEMAGRLGVLLTVVAVGVHFVALLGRGMAADPNRVP